MAGLMQHYDHLLDSNWSALRSYESEVSDVDDDILNTYNEFDTRMKNIKAAAESLRDEIDQRLVARRVPEERTPDWAEAITAACDALEVIG